MIHKMFWDIFIVSSNMMQILALWNENQSVQKNFRNKFHFQFKKLYFPNKKSNFFCL